MHVRGSEPQLAKHRHNVFFHSWPHEGVKYRNLLATCHLVVRFSDLGDSDVLCKVGMACQYRTSVARQSVRPLLD